MGSGLWGIAIVVGPILFIALALWVVVNNRRKPRDKQRTERGARALRKELNAEDVERDREDAAR